MFRRGFLCYGVPIGEDQYVDKKLTEVADKIVDDERKTVDVLAMNKQAL